MEELPACRRMHGVAGARLCSRGNVEEEEEEEEDRETT
jgi:hypothetical protein